MPEDNNFTSTTSTTSNNSNNNDEPRKKRAKIMSACGECRRKKTKCNGEQPCRNCQKSVANCIYPSTALSQSDVEKSNLSSKIALETIENRLKTIEDMLRAILQQQQTQQYQQDLIVPGGNQQPTQHEIHMMNNNNNNNNINRLPSIHNLSANLPPATTTATSSSSNNRNNIAIGAGGPPLPSPLGIRKQEQHPLEEHSSVIYHDRDMSIKKRKR